MINKQKLVYDATDGGDVVGSFLKASDGTLLTHTDVGGKKSLDVNVANTISISATDLDIRDLDASQDNVAISDGTDTLAINADGSINSVVSATDLDIRDLSHTQDSVKIGDGTDFLAIAADGSIAVTDNGGSLTVDATDLDIRDLSHAQDNVAIAQGGNTMVVNADGSINVNADISIVNGFEKAEDAAHASGDIGGFMLSVREDTLASSTSASGDYQAFKTDALGRLWMNDTHQTIAHAAVSVTTTATDLVASDLANRKRILIQNRGNRAIYIGGAAVTTANGMEVAGGSVAELDIGPGVNIHAITDSGSQNVRVLELA